jgi:hypothetical protein
VQFWFQSQSLGRCNPEAQGGSQSRNIWSQDRRLENNSDHNSDSSPMSTPTHAGEDTKQINSPQKPINLLPEVPSQPSRKLSEKEQRDCHIIGML